MRPTTTPDASTTVPAAAQPIQGMPAWYFGFEGVLTSSFDILKAFPAAWPVLVVLGATNLLVSLTVMRSRLKLLKALWKGRKTRMLAIGLLALRFAVHAGLGALGLAMESTAAHVAFAVGMGAITVTLLWFDQRVTLRALAKN
ncbi:hypothetical protein F0L68_25950 [Solihabitans fulvus]|uniref:Uncharacterized protein n=2 Tax=Solihabitans fulvus TaxID=1892852 RepID=A0A5B2WZH4_9PSEU|nr:hypothetical protein F0L68_25950 [Solihabitans fulvus]